MKYSVFMLATLLGGAHAAAVCDQEAHLEETSAGDNGAYTANPITIITQSSTWVSFKVSQNWVTGSLASMKVLFLDGTMQCETSSDVADASTTYTATCTDGVAKVGVFVGDPSFASGSGVTDISCDMPDACAAAVEGETEIDHSLYVSNVFTIPCDSSDEDFCPSEQCKAVEFPNPEDEGYEKCYDLYLSGNSDSSSSDYEILASAYCDANCDDGVYCFYVLAAEGNRVIEDSESWFKDYSVSADPMVPAVGIDFVEVDGQVIGWKGCYYIGDDPTGAAVELSSSIRKAYNDELLPASSGIEGVNTVSIEYPECVVDPRTTPINLPFVPPADLPVSSPVTAPVSAPINLGPADGTGDPPTDGESGGGFGDPHLKTWMGEVYDFHGACDLVLTRSKSFHNGAGLDVHIRTEMRDDWSFISAVAIRIGDDVFEVDEKAIYYLNGAGAVDLPETVGGFPVVKKTHGKRRTEFDIDLGHMGHFNVRVFGEFLAVEFFDAHADGFADAEGLMGAFADGSLVSRSGTVIADTNEFGLSWQVRDTDPQLFKTVAGPQYPQLCDMPEAKTLKERRMAESMVSFEDAEKACAAWDEKTKESCIYDVMATGDLSMAQAGAF